MTILSNIGNYAVLAVVFLLMISILVAAHELGHYLFARLFGMGVKEFAIGFGKRPIATWMRRTYAVNDPRYPDLKTETTAFTIRPLPLGGFVQIRGMLPEDDGSEVEVPGGFYSKAPWKRLIVLLAGPAFSVIAGIILLVPLYTIVGVERSANKPVIGPMKLDGAGYKSGLRPNDRIVSIDGKPIDTFYSFLTTVREGNAKPMQFVVERDGKQQTMQVTPEWTDTDAMVLDENLEPTGEFRRQPMLGVGMTSETKFVKQSVGEAFLTAANEPVRAIRNLAGLVQRPKNFERSVSGPVTMVALTQYALESGISKIVQLAALLSISVGIFNLLPFAPLDGGQMVVALVEMFRRGKRLSIRVQSAINGVGMALIGILVLGAWFFDFKHFFGPQDQGSKAVMPAAKK